MGLLERETSKQDFLKTIATQIQNVYELDRDLDPLMKESHLSSLEQIRQDAQANAHKIRKAASIGDRILRRVQKKQRDIYVSANKELAENIRQYASKSAQARLASTLEVGPIIPEFERMDSYLEERLRIRRMGSDFTSQSSNLRKSPFEERNPVYSESLLWHSLQNSTGELAPLAPPPRPRRKTLTSISTKTTGDTACPQASIGQDLANSTPSVKNSAKPTNHRRSSTVQTWETFGITVNGAQRYQNSERSIGSSKGSDEDLTENSRDRLHQEFEGA